MQSKTLITLALAGVVVSVAGLAVASGLAVGVHERRHEFAALQAIGNLKEETGLPALVQALDILAK